MGSYAASRDHRRDERRNCGNLCSCFQIRMNEVAPQMVRDLRAVHPDWIRAWEFYQFDDKSADYLYTAGDANEVPKQVFDWSERFRDAEVSDLSTTTCRRR